jgi:hypothetical protein
MNGCERQSGWTVAAIAAMARGGAAPARGGAAPDAQPEQRQKEPQERAAGAWR